MLIILIIIFIVIALFDVPGLIRKQYWLELAIYSGLMLTALILSILLVLEVPLPAVTTEIGNFIEAVFHLKKS